MRVLYLDLDAFRPDHLGCYGYHRPTSPNLDALAARSVRFSNCHCSDAPCLPSRTALYAGRPGISTGVVNHGGAVSTPFNEGLGRSFIDSFRRSSWPAALRDSGLYPAVVSPFGERHSAWHWYAGFREIINPGGCGMESAEEVTPLVADWLARRGRQENWFLHVNYWDAHIPYRAPAACGDPFADYPLPAWPHEGIRARDWMRPGENSPREVIGYDDAPHWVSAERFPRQPVVLRDMDDVRRQIDNYDLGIRYADEHVGRILNHLADLNVLDETAIIVSADHGENLGELGVWADHQTADEITTRVPLLFHWPGLSPDLAGAEARGLIYHFDFAATAIELAGGTVPENWHGQSFAPQLRSGNLDAIGRDHLVLSQGAHVCQRAVRWADSIYIRTFHHGYHGFPREMLFDLAADPHEERNLAAERPADVAHARGILEAWTRENVAANPAQTDPFDIVLAEGGPFHARGEAVERYLTRLRETERGDWADYFEHYPAEPPESHPLHAGW